MYSSYFQYIYIYFNIDRQVAAHGPQAKGEKSTVITDVNTWLVKLSEFNLVPNLMGVVC